MASFLASLAVPSAIGGVSALLGSRGRSSPQYGRPSNSGNWSFQDARTDYGANLYDPMYADWYNYAYGPEQEQLTNEGRGMWADMWGDRSRYQQQADHLYGGDATESQYYNPEEQAGMRRTDERYGAMSTPEEYAAMYMTPEEMQASGGDPWAGLNRFDQDAAGIRSDLDTREQRSFDTLGEQDRNIRGVGQRYRQGAGSALTSGASGMRGAVEGAGQDLDASGQSVRGLYGDPDILASEEFMRDYKFGPEDTRDLEHLATSGVGTRYQSEVEDIQRQAAAQGNSSPLALAAMRERANRASAREGADAAVGARAQGRQMELDTTRGREDVRLGAEQNQARLGTSSELSLADMLQRRRAMQLGAEQDIRNAELDNEGRQADFDAGNERYLGSSRLDTYGNIGNARQQAGQYIAGTGSGLAQGADDRATSRANDMARNRQETQRYTTGQRYNQGRQTALDSSDIERGIADQRLNFNQERRGYVSGMQAGSQAGALSSMGQRQGFYGTRGGLRNQASGNLGTYDINRRNQAYRDLAIPSRGERAISAGLGGFAGAGGGGGGD